MAAMSAASATANTITPPSSSHGNGNQSAWNTNENPQDKISAVKNDPNRAPLTQNGNSANIYEYGFEPLPPPRKKASNDNLSLGKKSRVDTDASSKPALNNADDVFGEKDGPSEKRPTSDPKGGPEDDSKWIHRDKLAQIESAELQAAGIVLPRPRASSRPRRGRSDEKLNGSTKRTTSAAADDELSRPRSRKASISPENRAPTEKMPDLDVSSWDLRRPEEIASDGDGNYWTSNGEKKSVSKIPVAKTSPAPIPESYIERNAPSARRLSGGPNELETIAYPKPRPRSGSANTLGATSGLQPPKRNVTETSPRKSSGASTTPASRKTSTQVKSTGKAKTRGGKDSTSTTRPTTRSGDLSPGIKKPEGDPPWMVGSFKPDPRLPPEQQLLPTVARRLQQEQWEREGKSGSIYDKDFRPLTAEGLLKPPEAGPSNASEGEEEEEKQEHDEWPLRDDAPKSPTSLSIKQSASYSTMPKLSDKPPTSPLASPRSPRSPMMPPEIPAQTPTVVRVPNQPSAAEMSMGGDRKKKKGGGCGCCIVM